MGLYTLLFSNFSLFLRLSTIHTLFVAANNMHIYAFIVPHMHKIAFSAHICTFSHIFSYLYMKLSHRLDVVSIKCIPETLWYHIYGYPGAFPTISKIAR